MRYHHQFTYGTQYDKEGVSIETGNLEMNMLSRVLSDLLQKVWLAFAFQAKRVALRIGR